MHPHNSFLTLTFEDEQMPESGSVDVLDLQLFMKRLRKSLEPKRVRFFACGEYTPLNLRPHYHILLFNHSFPDQKIFKINKNNQNIYTSSELQNLWTYGFSTTAELNYKTAAYCARYSLKKITGDRAGDHYTRPHCVTGNLVRVKPEFITMSRRPGIGARWLQQFKSDCYPSDFIIVDGKKHPIPKFYDKVLQSENERELDKLKRLRVRQSKKHRADQTPARLEVREAVTAATLRFFAKRTLI